MRSASALLVCAVFGCSEVETGTAEQATTIDNAFAQSFDDTWAGGGVAMFAAGLAGREDHGVDTTATLAVAGLPSNTVVKRALLYWVGNYTMPNTATVNGTTVVADQSATGPDACWGGFTTAARADVTALVSPSSTLVITGLPSTEDFNAPDTDGVALVVEYGDDSSTTRSRVVVRDGLLVLANGGPVTDSFAGLAVPLTTTGAFSLVVGDGQSALDAPTLFDAQDLGSDLWTGTSGGMIDARSFPVALTAAQDSATWSIDGGGDCLAFTSTILSYPVAVCGDGAVTGGEGCDDGNPSGDDGCSKTCAVEVGYTCTGSPSVCTPVCGDGIVRAGEACDDGGSSGGDGCSATCSVEPGFHCAGAPSVCTTTCGDGVIAGSEQCDDNNTSNHDGCSATCTIDLGWACSGAPSQCTSTCGDGVLASSEDCDDHNTTSGDGCSAACKVETGWSCTGTPSACTNHCGDGVINGSEQCDDSNTAADDGCSATCTVEVGYACVGAPSTCATRCGDALIAGDEACDDGNAIAGDGCSVTCQIEAGFTCDSSAMPSSCNDGDGGGCCSASGKDLPGSFVLVGFVALWQRRRRRV